MQGASPDNYALCFWNCLHYLVKKSMENFINIGLNNALAPLVKELVFHGQIPRKFPDQKTWERYIHLGLEKEGLKSGNPYW